MIKVKTKGSFYKCIHIWFCNDIIGKETNCDICTYYGIAKTPDEKKSTLQHTLINNLALDSAEIFERFSKNTKYEIKRSKKEKAKEFFYSSEELKNHPEIIDSFCDCYLSMYKSKGINCKSPKKLIEEYVAAGAIEITVAKMNDIPLVYHTYVKDETNVRLFHSCSDFRNTETSAQRATIGRLNRFLHWEDILHYQNQGVLQYDWGGISSYEEPNGIDEFKINFGGTYACYYNVTVFCSLKAKIINKIKNIRKR